MSISSSSKASVFAKDITAETKIQSHFCSFTAVLTPALAIWRIFGMEANVCQAGIKYWQHQIIWRALADKLATPIIVGREGIYVTRVVVILSTAA